MPDSYVEDLTAVTEAEPNDLFLLQREVGGVWTDYRTRLAYMEGVPIVTFTREIDVFDLTIGCLEILPTPPAGKQYMPVECFATINRPINTMLTMVPLMVLTWASGTYAMETQDVVDDVPDYAIKLLRAPSGVAAQETFDGAINGCFDVAFYAEAFFMQFTLRYVLVDTLSPL